MICRIILLIFIMACTCCTTSDLLKNGYTKVPRDNSIFNNPKFNPDVFRIIDTNSIYIETHSFYRGTKQLPKQYISILRFYSNGLYNEFTYDKGSMILNDLGSNSLDFKENGIRGYYYYNDEKLQLVSFGPTDELYTMGWNRSEIIVTQDGLLKQTYPNEKVMSYYYEKVIVPEKWKHLKPTKTWE
jgi:hypothetical protein